MIGCTHCVGQDSIHTWPGEAETKLKKSNKMWSVSGSKAYDFQYECNILQFMADLVTSINIPYIIAVAPSKISSQNTKGDVTNPTS